MCGNSPNLGGDAFGGNRALHCKVLPNPGVPFFHIVIRLSYLSRILRYCLGRSLLHTNARKAKLRTVAMSHPAHLPESPKSGSNVLNGLPPEDFSRRNASPVPSGLAHKIHRNWQDYGWHITIKKTLAYLVRSVHFRQVYRIYRIKLEGTKPSEDIAERRFTFKILTVQNLDMIAQIENIAEWLRGQLTGAISAGQMCLVALDGDEVAGFNLINFDHATLVLVNLKKKLRRDFAWSEHIAVKKEFRKTGLGSQLRFRIFQELKGRGILRLYGGTLRSNIASLSLARSVGFREIGDIHYRKFLSFEKWHCKRVRG